MNRMPRLTAALAAVLLAMPAFAGMAQDTTPAVDHHDIEIAFVLHSLNTFTEEMVSGAEDAARDYGVRLEVYAGASFDVEAQRADFEAALERGADGIAVAPLDGDLWVEPIQEAVNQGVPVVGFNVTSFESALQTWVGQDDFTSGVVLGAELLTQLTDTGVTKGQIAIGSCNPGETVLADREEGLREAFTGTAFEVLPAQDVHLPILENLAAWEHVIAANPDIVAAVGLCYVDVPNLAQLKQQTDASWLVGGYNLDELTLDAITSGGAQVVAGQQEYLQGYLSVAILAEHLIDGTPLVTGWLEIPTEVVTSANVESYVSREVDDQVQYDYYQTYVAEHFADLQAAARPYEDLRALGEKVATPGP